MLHNDFGGTPSILMQINDLGDATGAAEDASGGVVSFVTVAEARAAGTDMISLRQLMIDGGYYTPQPVPPPGSDPDPTLPSGLLLDGIAGITNSRQIAATAALVEGGAFVEMKPLLIQLAVTGGTVSIASIEDLSSPSTEIHGFDSCNNQGDILGHVTIEGVTHLLLYTAEDGWTDIGTADAVGRNLSERDANGAVYIVANNWRWHYSIPTGQTVSFIRLRGTYAKDPAASAAGVNSRGQVAGSIRVSRSDDHAALYDGTMKDLGSLTNSANWNDSWANAVNDSGIVVGGSFTGSAPGNTGLIYVNATGKTYDMANCLNAADRAVYKGLVAGNRADTNDLIDINATGMIIGPGLGGNWNLVGKKAFLLTPVSP